MVSEIRIINHDRYNLDISLESIIKTNGSIYQFLLFVEIDDIVAEIEKLYIRKPQFHAKGMFILSIAYHFYNKSYEKLLADISIFDIQILKFENRELPSSSQLCDFIVNRVGEETLEILMKKFAYKLYCLGKLNKTKVIGNEDSTPIEASRYDKYAEFNTHYKCKMYKAHITMLETIPLYMSFTNGVSGDNPESLNNMKTLSELGITFQVMNKDGGYDSFENYANTFVLLGAKPNIKPKENAVINEEGTIERINHFINKSKLWKKGLSMNDSIDRKLKFFYQENGKRREQVGAYLRNQILENGVDEEAYPLRKHQERIHDHMKGTIKFNVRRVHDKQKKHHTIWSFVSYQLLCLTALQNQLNPNEFGFVL